MNKLYIDLDGVFADFNYAVKDILGGYPGEIDRKLLWITLQKIPHFYLTLPLMGKAKESFDYILEHSTVPVEILTALPSPAKYLRTADQDKKEWVKEYLSPDIIVNCVSNWRDKVKFVNCNTDILVDDQMKNIDGWITNGGIGIHHHNFIATINTLFMYKIFRGE